MKTSLLVLLVVLLSSCGTLRSNIASDRQVQKSLENSKTYCKSITRVYSGVAYDFCKLHAGPGTTVSSPQTESASGTPLIFLDFMLSGVVDTLLLPYTVYKQVKDGSLDLE